jgi:DNA-binding Xre family transcriptional regulator
MARSSQIIDVLKHELRAQGINYRELAERLTLSESTIKHMFSSKNFSLKRLDRICEILGVEISDLVRRYEARTPKMEQLSLEHEKRLVSDAPLLLVAYCVVNQWSIHDILKRYNLSEPECIRCLAQLDRMKMIELLPENKIKLLVSSNFTWHRNGPIEQFFRREAQDRFLSGSFSGDHATRVVKIGDLSEKSILQLIDRINNVGELYDELSSEDSKQPFGTRHGTSMVLAIRKWEFHAFKAFQR